MKRCKPVRSAATNSDSSYAPIFEVVEKPDNWERTSTHKKSEAASGKDKSSETGIAFWMHYAKRHPDAARNGITLHRGWYSNFPMARGDILVSVWVGDKASKMYVRGKWRGEKHSAEKLLGDRAAAIADTLGATFTPGNSIGHLMHQRLSVSCLENANRDAIADRVGERRIA